MKKKLPVTLAGASLFLLGLASCGNNYQVGQIKNENIENLKEVVDDHLAANQVETDKDNEIGMSFSKYTNLDETKYELYGGFVGDTNENIAKVRQKEGGKYIGLYSIADGKFLVKPCYKEELLNYIQSSKTINFEGNYATSIIVIKYAGKYTYIDVYGNEFVKDSLDAYAFSDPTYYKNAYYVKFGNKYAGYKFIEYKVKDNGKATVVDKIPYDSDDLIEFKKDDLYIANNDKIKTADNEYYIRQYTAGSNTLLKVLDKDSKIVKTVEIEYGYSNLRTVIFQNGNLLVQYSVQLTEDAKDYAYSNGVNKFALTTLTTNIFDDSKVKEVNVPYIINGVTQVLGKEDKIAYNEINVRAILDNYTLGPTRYYLMKDDFKLANELEFNVNNLIKTKNGYILNLDGVNDVLYNDEFAFVTQINAANYIEGLDAFVFTITGSGRGVVSSNGKVIVPFEYNAISTTPIVDGKVYATDKNGIQGILDTKTGEFTSYKGFDVNDNNKLKFTKYDAATNKTTWANLGGSETKTGEFKQVATNSTFFGTKYVFDRTDLEDPEKEETYILTVNDYYFNSIGTELTAEYELNNTAVKAVTLNSNANKDVTILANGSYFKITSANDDSKMTIKTRTKLNSEIDIYSSEDPYGYLTSKNAKETTEKDEDGRTIYVYTIMGIDAGTVIAKVSAYYNSEITDVNIKMEVVPAQA